MTPVRICDEIAIVSSGSCLPQIKDKKHHAEKHVSAKEIRYGMNRSAGFFCTQTDFSGKSRLRWKPRAGRNETLSILIKVM